MKILLNTATHGDEKIGSRVATHIKKYPLRRGEIIFNIANERAFALNKRFIDQDLNRSFPGKARGNHEERLAYKLTPTITSSDLVFDIHSTTSLLRDAVIVTRLTQKTKRLIEVINPKYVLVMNVTKNTALISQAKIGIAFEYGKDTDPRAIKKTVEAIRRVLVHLKMIEGTIKKSNGSKPVYFNVTHVVRKPIGFKLHRSIKNYKLVKKGQTYALSLDGSKELVAERDFYPILFGEKNYKEYFGFSAQLYK